MYRHLTSRLAALSVIGLCLLIGCGKSEKQLAAKEKTISSSKGAVTSNRAKLDKISFNHHVRPIISDKCFACHGPDVDNQQSPFRLDSQENSRMNLAKEGEATRYGIVPGNPEESQILYRIAHVDPSQQMPPPAAKKAPLTKEEIAIIRQWISEGAEYEKHWAFVTPEKPALPEVALKDWIKNPIDHFILAKLESKGISPSPEADKETLIRRVYMDLTGIPPSPIEIDTYLADNAATAYESMVDKVMSSKHYGERMAIDWLDTSRFGDTNAIQLNLMRTSWPWRDWVINAFNTNMPYEQFITEQLAGDLIPDASVQQKLATAFNRHHPITVEGGVVPEEFLVEYAVDRVSTMGSAFMGLTLGCARCHDHKFDPITQDDFFSLMAFFNNIPERGLERQVEYIACAFPPYVTLHTEEQKKTLTQSEKTMTEFERLKALPQEKQPPVLNDEKALAWELLDATAVKLETGKIPPLKIVDHKAFQKRNYDTINKSTKTKELRFEALLGYDPIIHLDFTAPKSAFNTLRIEAIQAARALVNFRPDDFSTQLIELEIEHVDGKKVTPLEIDHANTNLRHITDSISNAFDANNTSYWDIPPAKSDYHLFFQLKKNVSLTTGHLRIRLKLKGYYHQEKFLTKFAFYAGENPHGLESPIALIPSDQRRLWQQEDSLMSQHHAKGNTNFNGDDLSVARHQLEHLELMATRCSVMEEKPQINPTYVLNRGLYDQPIKDRPRPRVTPAVLAPMDDNMPKNRLGLAQWIVRDDNPLTARVAVNRFWQQIFQHGIVKSSNDFGLQSDPPSHPALLDYLAVDFRENNWDVKHLMKQLVMSATYRQSSKVRSELLEIDPDNRLLAKAPRYRFPAEVIRDNALSASGLLVKDIGGPSVKPYQPDGLWSEKAIQRYRSTGTFKRDTGDKLYRRGLYTFMMQAAPAPQMVLFDAPSREFCNTKREITNTPLQALALMNDEMYLEMSRELATRVIKDVEGEWDEQLANRIEHGLRLTTGRKPTQAELDRWVRFTQENFEKFSAAPDDAKGLISYGEKKAIESIPEPQLAALTFSMSAALNLDETITRD